MDGYESGENNLAKKLVDGLSAFGYVYGFGEDKIPANLSIQDGEAKILLLGLAETPEAYMNYNKEEIPDFAQFRSSKVNVSLSKISRASGGALDLIGGMNTSAFRCDRVIRSSEPLSYDSLNGMTSTLEGFVRWSGVEIFEQSFHYENDNFVSSTLKTELVQPVELGSQFSVTASSGFASKPIYSAGSLSEITYKDSTKLGTETAGLRTWEEHQRVHQMIQDLMCLVYSYPCSMQIDSVVRDDGQPEFVEEDGRKLWPEAFTPVMGRQRHFEPKQDFARLKPLFQLEDTDKDLVADWIDNFHRWSRPTWIAVESLFQPYLAAESRMLQMGAAMEALGYAIWLYDEHGGYAPECEKAGRRHKCSFVGCDKPNAERYFWRVAKDLPFAELNIAEEQTAEEWAKAFNLTYRGCKHADNDLPDGVEAYKRAKQGLQVIRCWLAKKLGVSDEVLVQNKDLLK